MTKHKYRAIPTEVDGIGFASKLEAHRYRQLKLLGKANKIHTIEIQPRFDCTINNFKVCTYVADFSYFDIESNCFVVEDVKGYDTRVSRLKRKLVKALHGIDVRIVK